MRYCKNCKTEKTLDCFPTCKNCKEEREYECKVCKYSRRKEIHLPKEKVRRKELYNNMKLSNPEKYQEYLLNKREYRQRKKLHFLVNSARRRAAQEGYAFNISESDLIIPEYCPILGTKLELQKANNNLNAPSIDKIVPSLGYIVGNVRVISRKANMMKLNCSFDELKVFAKNIIQYINDYETQQKISEGKGL